MGDGGIAGAGVGIGIVAVIAAALQYPATAWAVRSVEDGLWDSFVPLDLGIGVVLSGVLFGFPAWLVWVGRREKQARAQAPVAVESSRAVE